MNLLELTENELGELQQAVMVEVERRHLEAMDPETRAWTIKAHQDRFGWIQPSGADGDPWEPPNGAYNSYKPGDRRTHNGHLWENTILGNPHEPGVAGWTIVSDGPAPWVQPSGADSDRYMTGAQCTHNGILWESTVDYNVWIPGEYGWNNLGPTE